VPVAVAILIKMS